MEKISTLKKWLTIDETASHLSRELDENLDRRDIFRLISEGELAASINLIGSYGFKTIRLERDMPPEEICEIEDFDVNPLDGVYRINIHNRLKKSLINKILKIENPPVNLNEPKDNLKVIDDQGNEWNVAQRIWGTNEDNKELGYIAEVSVSFSKNIPDERNITEYQAYISHCILCLKHILENKEKHKKRRKEEIEQGVTDEEEKYIWIHETPDLSEIVIKTQDLRNFLDTNIASMGTSSFTPPSEENNLNHCPSLQEAANPIAREYREKFKRWPTKIQVAKTLKIKHPKLTSHLDEYTVMRRIRSQWKKPT